MAIPDLNLISDFEAGIKCLQNPSVISKLSSFHKLPQLYSFWTFGALILAIFATFTTVFNRIKNLTHQIWIKLLNFYQNSFPKPNFDQDCFDFDFDSDFDFSDDDNNSPTPASESDDEVLDSQNGRENEVFRAEGDNGLNLRRIGRFSWSDFSAGKSVVQLWDSLGLGLGFENDETDENGEISIWDLDKDMKLSSGRVAPVKLPVTENVVLTAEMDREDGGVGFGMCDWRVSEDGPAVCATWRPRRRKFWLNGDGVAGDGGGLTGERFYS